MSFDRFADDSGLRLDAEVRAYEAQQAPSDTCAADAADAYVHCARCQRLVLSAYAVDGAGDVVGMVFCGECAAVV